MAKLTKYQILLLTGCMALFSCTEDDPKDYGREDRSPYLQEISVVRATRSAAGSETGSEAGSDSGANSDKPAPPPYDGEEIFDVEFVENESYLYVSQGTRYLNPFQTKTYKYVYFNNTNAGWEEGFNFKPCDEGYDKDTEVNPNALNWETVGQNGSVGNGFALYAMYYPGQVNGLRSVAADQSRLTDLRNSDILGAYHSTSALYSRVRFMLHHLMVYVKVNLYVPVFGETWKTEDKKLENQGFSGYTAESLTDAFVMKACPDFTVDWAASISSEGSPAVNLPDGYADKLTNIRMYSHAHADAGYEVPDETQSAPDGKSARAGAAEEEDQGGESGPEEVKAIRPVKKTRIDISQFLPKDMIDIQPMDPAEDGKIYDDVFMYSFSVIIPAQYADFTSQNPGFLKFAFKRPSTNTDKNYYFSSGFSSNSQSSVLEPNKGTLQVLNLYLPRKGDEVILIGAQIQDWTNVDTDMNLQPQDKDKDTNS